MHPLMTYCFALAIGLGAGTALAQTASKNVSKADQAFLKETVEGDLAEVNMGKLAQEKAQSQAVKDFGKMLEQDHGEHLQMARSKAQELGVNAPDEPNAKQKANA